MRFSLCEYGNHQRPWYPCIHQCVGLSEAEHCCDKRIVKWFSFTKSFFSRFQKRFSYHRLGAMSSESAQHVRHRIFYDRNRVFTQQAGWAVSHSSRIFIVARTSPGSSEQNRCHSWKKTSRYSLLQLLGLKAQWWIVRYDNHQLWCVPSTAYKISLCCTLVLGWGCSAREVSDNWGAESMNSVMDIHDHPF